MDRPQLILDVPDASTPKSESFQTTRVSPGEHRMTYRGFTARAILNEDRWSWRLELIGTHVTQLPGLPKVDSLKKLRGIWTDWVDLQVGGAVPAEQRIGKIDYSQFPAGYDPLIPVKLIDGIPHLFYAPGKHDNLTGPWNWIGPDGLNPHERRTNRSFARWEANDPKPRPQLSDDGIAEE